MKGEFGIGHVALLYFLGCVIVGVICFYDYYTFEIHAQDASNEECRNMGYDNYYEYSRVPFTPNVYGLKCEYAYKVITEERERR